MTEWSCRKVVICLINPNYNLMNRLERAACLIRADMLSAQIKAHELELKADELSEQAKLLDDARNQLWNDILYPKNTEDK